MPTKKDQPKPAEGKPRAALETASGGVTVIESERVVEINIEGGIFSGDELRDAIIPEIEKALADVKPNNEDPTDAD